MNTELHSAYPMTESLYEMYAQHFEARGGVSRMRLRVNNYDLEFQLGNGQVVTLPHEYLPRCFKRPNTSPNHKLQARWLRRFGIKPSRAMELAVHYSKGRPE